MFDAASIPRDPAALRRAVAQARAMLADPAYRPLRRRLLVLVVQLEAIAMALDVVPGPLAEPIAADSGISPPDPSTR